MQRGIMSWKLNMVMKKASMYVGHKPITSVRFNFRKMRQITCIGRLCKHKMMME